LSACPYQWTTDPKHFREGDYVNSGNYIAISNQTSAACRIRTTAKLDLGNLIATNQRLVIIAGAQYLELA
jgi:hypothetical protein